MSTAASLPSAFWPGQSSTSAFIATHCSRHQPQPLQCSHRSQSFPPPLSYTITKVLITHGHPDHVAGLFETKEALPDAEICIHPLDVDTLRAATDIGSVSPFWHSSRAAQCPARLPTNSQPAPPSTLLQVFSLVIPELPAPDTMVQDNDVIHVGNLRLRAIHTPGMPAIPHGTLLFHSPRQPCFFPFCPPLIAAAVTFCSQAMPWATCASTKPRRICSLQAISSFAAQWAGRVRGPPPRRPRSQPRIATSIPNSTPAPCQRFHPNLAPPSDLPGADSKTLHQSLLKLQREVPDRETHVFPGHMDPTVLLDECRSNYFLAPLAAKLDKERQANK